jgi:hypothetical protein
MKKAPESELIVARRLDGAGFCSTDERDQGSARARNREEMERLNRKNSRISDEILVLLQETALQIYRSLIVKHLQDSTQR